MTRKLLWLPVLLLVLLTACHSQSAADLVDSGRRRIEASDCQGVTQYTEAVSDLQAALAADPGELEAYYWLYIAYNRSGNTTAADEAVNSLRAALEANSSNPKGWFWLFKVYGEQGDQDAQGEALTELEAISQANPGDADAHFWLGRAYHEQGQDDVAMQSFQSAVTMDSEHELAHFWLGQMYTKQNQLDMALQEFGIVLRVNDNNAAAYHNRGVVAYQLGDLDQAVSDLTNAIENDPNDPRSHYQLGAVHLAQALPDSMDITSAPDGDLLDQAATEFDKALELCPGMLEPLIGQGNLYLLQNNPNEAIASLNQAIAQSPDSLEAWFALGQAHASIGQLEEACTDLDHFLSLSPPQGWVEQAEQIRAQLGCP